MNFKFNQSQILRDENGLELSQTHRQFTQNGANFELLQQDYDPETQTWDKTSSQGEVFSCSDSRFLKIKPNQSFDYQLIDTEKSCFCEGDYNLVLSFKYPTLQPKSWETLQTLGKLASFLLEQICGHPWHAQFAEKSWLQSIKDKEACLSSFEPLSDSLLLALYQKSMNLFYISLQNQQLPFHLSILAHVREYFGKTSQLCKVELINLAPQREQIIAALKADFLPKHKQISLIES